MAARTPRQPRLQQTGQIARASPPQRLAQQTNPSSCMCNLHRPCGRWLWRETERKFALSPQARAAVERHVLTLASERQPVVETDHTTYYDTPDGALRQAGFSLRIRHRLDTDEYRQTVKSAGDGGFSRG